MKLWDIGAAILAIMAEAEESGGEVTEEQYADLTALGIEFDEKVQDIALYVRTMETEQEVIESEMKRLKTKAAARATRVERLKAYLLEQLQARGLRKAGGVKAGVRLQNNPPSVNVVEETAIPLTYWIAREPTLDKTAILTALKAGQPVAGCEIKQGEHLRIV